MIVPIKSRISNGGHLTLAKETGSRQSLIDDFWTAGPLQPLLMFVHDSPS